MTLTLLCISELFSSSSHFLSSPSLRAVLNRSALIFHGPEREKKKKLFFLFVTDSLALPD